MSSLKDRRGTWRQALVSLAGAILMILSIRWAFFEPYVIPSGSMIPTLLIHDHILVNKFSYGVHLPFSTSWLFRFTTPRRGDVVVFRSVEDGGVFIIKRVIGLPGEKIDVAPDGQISVNGAPVERRKMSQLELEEYLVEWPSEERQEVLERYDFYQETLDGHPHISMQIRDAKAKLSGAYQVGADQLFMMGDNRDNSSDSRSWGALPMDRVLGRAATIWMSCEETLPDASQMCNPQTMRWYRIFKGI